VDESAAHFAADPTADVAMHVDFAAAHFAAEVPTGWAVNVNLATPHVSAKPMYAGKIALELKVLVGRSSADRKHFGKRQPAIAVKDLESLDLGKRFIAYPIGCEPFDFDRKGCLAAIRKLDWHCFSIIRSE
jgi:hypothetical protein